MREVEGILNVTGDSDVRNELGIIKSIVVRVYEQLFGVIFWFIILGATGALLYSLVVHMKNKFDGVHDAYADTVRNLHRVLIWSSARLLALGFALGGSLVDALEKAVARQ